VSAVTSASSGNFMTIFPPAIPGLDFIG